MRSLSQLRSPEIKYFILNENFISRDGKKSLILTLYHDLEVSVPSPFSVIAKEEPTAH